MKIVNQMRRALGWTKWNFVQYRLGLIFGKRYRLNWYKNNAGKTLWGIDIYAQDKKIKAAPITKEQFESLIAACSSADSSD